MGQLIQPQFRDRILRNPSVHAVTAQHVILRDGRVLDPVDFVMEQRAALFVLRLRHCRCWFAAHRPGLHALVQGHVKIFGTGREENTPGRPGVCPRGDWLIEEIMRVPM